MAVTKIKPLKTQNHVATAIRYATEDKPDIEDSSLIHKTINTYINTNEFNTADEWKMFRDVHKQDKGILAFQLIQNFGEDVDPQLANKIGVDFAKELLGDRQIIVSTHTNTPYIHNHILFNSPDKNGVKYYNNKDTYYNQVRKISDKLCEKYGLRVLEDTREGTLCFYKDSSGKTRYFEPTDRKSAIDYNERCGQIETWRTAAKKEKSKTANIINDMELVIPLSKDYEDFLRRMRNLGYTIRAKTSKGEWLKHINFIPPNSPSGARGYRDTNKLLAGYTRAEVTARIAELQEKSAHREDINYTHDDIDSIEQNRRRSGKPRSQLDKLLASEIQRLNRKINADFYSAFKRTRQLPPVTRMNRKDQDLLRKINSGLSTLSFIERSGVDTFNILQSRMKNAMQKRDEVAAELRGAKNNLSKANELLACINKIGDIESHIEKQKAIYGDAYTELENEIEVELYNAMQKKLAEAGLQSESERQAFINRMDVYKNDYKRLVAAVQRASDELYSLDDIFRELGSITTAQENYSAQLHEYQIERFGEEKEQEEDRSRSHGYHEH